TLRRLVSGADILIHNLRLPAARRLGLATEEVRKINPKIIYCHVSAFGPRGPFADAPGLDPMAQSCSGIMAAAGPPGAPPMWHRMLPGDCGTGLITLAAVLFALYRRRRSGCGSTVRASMLGAGALLSGETLATMPGQQISETASVNADVT